MLELFGWKVSQLLKLPFWRGEERERQNRGGGKTPPWLEIVNAENPTVLVAGPLSEARIIVMIVW